MANNDDSDVIYESTPTNNPIYQAWRDAVEDQQKLNLLRHLKQLIEHQLNVVQTPHNLEINVLDEAIDEHDVDAGNLAQSLEAVLYEAPGLALELAIDLIDELDDELFDQKTSDVVARIDDVIDAIEPEDNN